jgi:hypothetical protein
MNPHSGGQPKTGAQTVIVRTAGGQELGYPWATSVRVDRRGDLRVAGLASAGLPPVRRVGQLHREEPAQRPADAMTRDRIAEHAASYSASAWSSTAATRSSSGPTRSRSATMTTRSSTRIWHTAPPGTGRYGGGSARAREVSSPPLGAVAALGGVHRTAHHRSSAPDMGHHDPHAASLPSPAGGHQRPATRPCCQATAHRGPLIPRRLP